MSPAPMCHQCIYPVYNMYDDVQFWKCIKRTSRFAHFAPYCVCASLTLNTALGSDVWPELSPPSWLSYDNVAHTVLSFRGLVNLHLSGSA